MLTFVLSTSDFSCGKGTLQGRKKNVYFKRENFTFWPNWLCIENSSAGHANITKGLMKPWRMTVSKVHIIYGEVAVGKQPAVHLRCFWWPESHEWSLEFLGQNLVVEPKLSWQPLPQCAIPPMHTLTQTHASPCTQLKANTHPCMLCHPNQRTWSSCKVPKSAACMLGWWEQTSWKQWNGLIYGFASGFGKGPCSKATFLWPLLKTSYLSLPIPSALVLFVNIARVDYQRCCVSN